MKEILESIILNIVDDKSAVTITEKVNVEDVRYDVKVANNDMGRVAKAIRTLMRSLGAKEKKRITIEFID